MVSLKEQFKQAVKKLEAAGNDNAEFDAGELFEKAFGFGVTSPKAEQYTCEKGTLAFEMMIDKRAGGYPLQYILGEWEFYGVPLKVGEGVLIPRQDTETLVETVIRKNRNVPPVIIDLCSGSGCIALALEQELDAKMIFAVEKSKRAAEYAKENISLNSS